MQFFVTLIYLVCKWIKVILKFIRAQKAQNVIFDCWLSLKCTFCTFWFALSFSFQEKVPFLFIYINMDFNITVFLCKCNVMHLSIILWHCIINHNKIRFRAQSEKLFCWISLLPFTRSVNMTESLSCIWVCVCAEHELLSDTWTDCCGEHVHWLCEVTLRQRRTHTHHARTSLWVPQSFTTFQHDICMHNGF